MVVKISAIVVAAGLSSRYGEENKLTSMLHGMPLIRHAVDAVLAAGAETWVVTGHDAPSIEQALEGLPVRFVFNSRYALGMGTSIAMGVRAADRDSHGYLIVPADMPNVDPTTIIKMVSMLNGSGGIVTLSDGENQSSPTLFGADYRVLLWNLKGDQGAKAILRLSDRVTELVVSPEELADVDVPT